MRELVDQVRDHFRFEVCWLVEHALRFANENEGDPGVALLDSVALHARNLIEWAHMKRNGDRFCARLMGGTAAGAGDPWATWANAWVLHAWGRDTATRWYPEGIDPTDPTRFVTMARRVLAILADTRPPQATTAHWLAVDEILAAAGRRLDGSFTEEDQRVLWGEPDVPRGGVRSVTTGSTVRGL